MAKNKNPQAPLRFWAIDRHALARVAGLRRAETGETNAAKAMGNSSRLLGNFLVAQRIQGRVKADRAATEAAGFADARSFVGLRLHPGTDHPCIYLRGADVGPVRERIFQRDGFHCQLRIACQGLQFLPLEGNIWTRGHLEHKQGGLGLQRCWCDENLRLACYACHMAKDGRFPRFGEGRGESAETAK